MHVHAGVPVEPEVSVHGGPLHELELGGRGVPLHAAGHLVGPDTDPEPPDRNVVHVIVEQVRALFVAGVHVDVHLVPDVLAERVPLQPHPHPLDAEGTGIRLVLQILERVPDLTVPVQGAAEPAVPALVGEAPTARQAGRWFPAFQFLPLGLGEDPLLHQALEKIHLGAARGRGHEHGRGQDEGNKGTGQGRPPGEPGKRNGPFRTEGAATVHSAPGGERTTPPATSFPSRGGPAVSRRTRWSPTRALPGPRSVFRAGRRAGCDRTGVPGAPLRPEDTAFAEPTGRRQGESTRRSGVAIAPGRSQAPPRTSGNPVGGLHVGRPP